MAIIANVSPLLPLHGDCKVTPIERRGGGREGGDTHCKNKLIVILHKLPKLAKKINQSHSIDEKGESA